MDKVKAGNWGKTLRAVASLGAAATSVGVSVGVAAAEPLAKDLAKGIEDLAVKGLQSTASPMVRGANGPRGLNFSHAPRTPNSCVVFCVFVFMSLCEQ